MPPPQHEPPANLRAFDPAQWADAEWESPGQGYAGSDEFWIVQLRLRAWTRARLDYAAVHGWPTDSVEMIGEHVRVRRAMVERLL